MDFLQRTRILFPKIDELITKSVCVVGVGGVGGYVCEMLVRSGVGNLTIIDFDKVSESNINRQIIALNSTIGQPKVNVLKERLKDINPKCTICAINEKLSEQNINLLISKEFDFVVDAIDSVKDKIALINYAILNKINIVSALGAGNRTGIPHFEVLDIYKTHSDGLARAVRDGLRKLNIKSHTVICSQSKAQTNQKTIGSVAYYPAMCGCVVSAYVINKLHEEA